MPKMARSSLSEKQAHRRAKDLQALTENIRACRICRDAPEGAPLAHEPRPVLQVSASARVLVAGQAPGTRVHATGLPFNDPSGDRLRQWMGIGRDIFYNPEKLAIVPMGFCFPGQDARKADLPPRRECRRAWHDLLLDHMPQLELVLVIGMYAQDYHFPRLGLARPGKARLTDIVRAWRDYAGTSPRIYPLPHPSWRNTGWLKKNPWFEQEVLPELQADVARLL